MKGLRKYVIPFRGLRDGKHKFEFEINDSFFEQFDTSEIKNGKLNVEVILDKNPQIIKLEFMITGKVKTICDRCLDELELPVKYEGQLFYKFGEKSYELSDEIIILSPSSFEIDLTQYIYEFIHLSLPYRRIHTEKDGETGCNLQMINKLNTLRVNDTE